MYGTMSSYILWFSFRGLFFCTISQSQSYVNFSCSICRLVNGQTSPTWGEHSLPKRLPHLVVHNRFVFVNIGEIMWWWVMLKYSLPGFVRPLFSKVSWEWGAVNEKGILKILKYFVDHDMREWQNAPLIVGSVRGKMVAMGPYVEAGVNIWKIKEI